MASLHNVTESTKKFLKLAAIAVVGIVILVFAIRFLLSLIPEKQVLPKAEFGELPAIAFPKNITDEALSYVVDTVDATLPDLGDRADVYQIINERLRLNDLADAKAQVAGAGFGGKEILISDNLYRWDSASGLGRSIEMDIVTDNFKLRSNYFSSAPVKEARSLPDEESAKTQAVEFFRSMQHFPDDMDTSLSQVKFLTIQGRTLVDATSEASAQIVRVDLYQKSIDDLPIQYPNPPSSSINVLLSGTVTGSRQQVVEANYYHHTIDSANPSDYPIKTTQEAFDELENGKAYIAAKFTRDSEISIRDVYLAYYSGDDIQDYLMPIYVFINEDNSFFAYVSAVQNDWIKQE